MTGESKELLKRWGLALAVVGVILFLAWKLENVSTLALLAFLLAYVLNPLVTRLARVRFFNRDTAALVIIVGLVLVFLSVFLLIVPQVVIDANRFIQRLPSYLVRAQETIGPWFERVFGVPLPSTADEVLASLQTQLRAAVSPDLIGTGGDALTVVLDHTRAAVTLLVSALMLPLFIFFLLRGFPRILEVVDSLVPLRNRAGIRVLASEVDESLSSYLHGQFTVMVILATLYAIGYSIVGIPVAIGIGLLTGMLCFIPYVGPGFGFLIAVLLAALEFKGAEPVLGVMIVFGIVQGLDAVLITPKIMSRRLGLEPLWIIVALMAGGELFGFFGVLLAVPSLAVLKIVVKHSVASYRSSRLFLSPPLDEPPPPTAPVADATPDPAHE